MRILDGKYRSCKSTNDYYKFAQEVFPSHQIQSEIVKFLYFAASESPRIVAEIGTAQGGTNFLLGQTLPLVSLKIGIDLHVRNRKLLERFARTSCNQRFVNGESCSKSVIDRIRKHLNGCKIDMLFIDGDHTYSGVKADYMLYREFVRDGGLIAFHDIVPDYKTRYGRDTGRWAGEVPVFWREIFQDHEHWEFVEEPGQDGLGIGVIRHRNQSNSAS